MRWHLCGRGPIGSTLRARCLFLLSRLCLPCRVTGVLPRSCQAADPCDIAVCSSTGRYCCSAITVAVMGDTESAGDAASLPDYLGMAIDEALKGTSVERIVSPSSWKTADGACLLFLAIS